MPNTHLSLAPGATQKAAVYAASCNPPRKAKRIRVDNAASNVEATATTSASTQQLTAPPAQNVRIRPAPPSIAPARAISPAAAVDESTAVGPKKRGRKPGAMSRSARETQRKINHSRIEKARRSKINDALDALRALVPPDFGKEKETEDDFEQSSKSGNKKEEKEREFKLDILERTVLFVEDLIDKLSRLESGQPSSGPCNCRLSSNVASSSNIPPAGDVALGAKRKYIEDDHESLSITSAGEPEDNEDGDDGEARTAVERSSLPLERSCGRETESHRRIARSTESIRLPSISNLLNHVPAENPPFSRSGSLSVHGSPYAPFGPHIYSTTVHTRSPTSSHLDKITPMSRRPSTSTSSSVLAFSPSFRACSSDRTAVGNTRDAMSPLALGLPSPPSSGSTNPHHAHVGQADPGPPPALKLPSPRSSPSEMQKATLPATASAPSRPHNTSSRVRSGNRNDCGDPASRWQPTSPSWTREDESAASLLLQISSTSSSSRSDSSSPTIVRAPISALARTPAALEDSLHCDGRVERAPAYREDTSTRSMSDDRAPSRTSVEVQTPGLLLGIRTKVS